MRRILWITALAAFIACGAAGPLAAQGALEFDLSEPPKAPTAPVDQQPVAKAPAPEEKVEPEGKVIGVLGIVTKDNAPIAVPDKRGIASVVRCPHGTYITVTQEWGEWLGVLMLNGGVGWIKRGCVYVTDYQVIQPAQRPDAAGRGSVGGQRVIQIAASMQGMPYKYGGNGVGGADCSAFVQMVFARMGVSLPRTAAEQAGVGQLVRWPDLQPGDRLYFAMKGSRVDHCGIYAGGNMFIHCSSNRDGVAFERIDVPKYASKLVVARR
jgi:cell wall-associated NlpC family hydrolase